jgi:putative transposase
MPEHVHLLLWPQLPEHPVSDVLRDLKRDLGQQVIERWRTLHAPILSRLLASDGTTRFWQRGGGFDRNIFSDDEFFEKLNSIHNNPVERGLVKKPEDWKWSSARWYVLKSSNEDGPAMDSLPPRKP